MDLAAIVVGVARRSRHWAPGSRRPPIARGRGPTARRGGGAARVQDALDRRERSAREDRRVQDLILVDDAGRRAPPRRGLADRVRERALERHLGARPDGAGADLSRHRRQRETGTRGGRATDTTIGRGGARHSHAVAPRRGDARPATTARCSVVVTDVTESRRIDAVRRDFVANASHELKTPAASIQAAAETLARRGGRRPEAVARFAAQLERDALRLSRIVMDLLDLSRLETEQRRPRTRPAGDARCTRRSNALRADGR